MMWFIQICAVFITIQCLRVDTSPIFESINIERKVNIGFKPFKLRPISFIREKWGPFGRYGKKHSIERRDLNGVNAIDRENEIKPVTEMKQEVIKPVVEVVDELDPIPSRLPKAIIKDNAPVSKLNTDISSLIAPAHPNYFTPVEKPINLESLGPMPIVETAPIEGPLFVPMTPPVSPPSPSLSPPPAPVVEEPPPRFGGLARFFGEIISEIFNRIIARARASFLPNQN